MPVPIVAGNWKMNTTIEEAVDLAKKVRELVGDPVGVEVILCPPYVSLAAVSVALKGCRIRIGAQNMSHQEKGAYTGEVSANMLTGLAQCVILGHSERRHHFGETNDLINLKVNAALAVGLRPILCVGETLEQRQAGRAADVVGGQVRDSLAGVLDIMDLAVAYEPVWAIGTGVAATPDTATKIMGGVILGTLAELYSRDTAAAVPLLYGGSVTPDNVAGFVAQGCVHGALVGGASLRAEQFAEIVKITARAKGSAE